MKLSNDQRAELVSDMLDWQISAALGARDTMREGCPTWRMMDAYLAHLTNSKNVLLKYGGVVFDSEFAMPRFGDA